jgi:fumarylpyruvate hydrolase
MPPTDVPPNELVIPAPQTTVVPVSTGGYFPVRRIYCVGRNYVSHIKEMKEADERDPPFFFQKPRDAILWNKEAIEYPPETTDFQFEVELVVAIGRDAISVSADMALDCVWGYAIGLDMTRRDRQRDARDMQLPWEKGKSFDQSAPCGPLYPVAQVGHVAAGAITLSGNGAERQRGDLREMIWSVPEIIAQLSKEVQLKPGDLIFTGTPAGVGPVEPGDKLDCHIQGIGSVSFTIADPNNRFIRPGVRQG